jgi:hypothetical protein
MTIDELIATARAATKGVRTVELDYHYGKKYWPTGFARVLIGSQILNEYMDEEDAVFIANWSPSVAIAALSAVKALVEQPCRCPPKSPHNTFTEVVIEPDISTTAASVRQVTVEPTKCSRCTAIAAVRESGVEL